jgi:hypothetical protein
MNRRALGVLVMVGLAAASVAWILTGPLVSANEPVPDQGDRATLYANLMVDNVGIKAGGTVGGAIFKDTNSSGKAKIAYGNYGIMAEGKVAGGYFEDPKASGRAYVGYGNTGVTAMSNGDAGYFESSASGGTACYAGSMFGGIDGYAASYGGYFGDYDGSYCYAGYGTYSTYGNGSKNFVQNHPEDDSRVISYSCLEGDEVGTYTRGRARLVNGLARVPLGDTFKWVTNPDLGLTGHLTPRGEPVPLAIVSLTPEELVVRGPADGPPDLAFDYIVHGLRVGFEEVSIVQEKRQEAYIPSMTEHRELQRAQPDLRKYTAMTRFKAMESDLQGVHPEGLDLRRSAALRDAIHEHDPSVDGPTVGRSSDRAAQDPETCEVH